MDPTGAPTPYRGLMKRRLTKPVQRTLFTALTDVLLSYPQMVHDPDAFYPFALPTRGGTLRLQPNVTEHGPTVFARFDDVDAANAAFGEHPAIVLHHNPASGKYNLHFGLDVTPEYVAHALRRHIDRTL